MFKKFEQEARHNIKKTVAKIKLDSERDTARQALEEANQGLAEINQFITTREKDLKDLLENLYLLLTEVTTHKALEKLAAAQFKIIAMNVKFEEFLEVQKLIITQHNIAQTERGNVSQIPNVISSSKQAEIQGKEACRKSQQATQAIKQALHSIQLDLKLFQATKQECIVDFEEAKVLQQKESEKIQKLIAATRAGDLTQVKALIETEALDPNEAIAYSKQTALHFASLPETPNNEELLIYLLTKGANPTARDHHHWTPIHYAIHTKNQSIIDLYSANKFITEEYQQFSNHPTHVLTHPLSKQEVANKIDYEKISRFFLKEYQELFKKFQNLEAENQCLKKLGVEEKHFIDNPKQPESINTPIVKLT